MKKPLTYKSSGVNIDEGDAFVRLIKPLAKSTNRNGVMGSIGGFGALFSGNFKGMKEPVLVSGTDGVGTKLKIAFDTGRSDTIGIDLVAMCVNDLVTSGAEPLFFLDYLSTGALDARRAADVIKGIAKGCKDAGCALIGGETAEMPGLYKKGEYDLAGFAVGVVDKHKIIDGSTVTPGDTILALPSSGLHSNGYSLVRKLFFERLKMKPGDRVKGLKTTLGTELLRPTRIYVKSLLELTRRHRIKAMAHITGGGLLENIPRVLPRGTKAVINRNSWKMPAIFRKIQELGNVEEAEMLRTFNCGVGMALVVSKRSTKSIMSKLKNLGEKPVVIGQIEKTENDAKTYVEFVG